MQLQKKQDRGENIDFSASKKSGECDICKKTFSTLNLFEMHLRTHAGEM